MKWSKDGSKIFAPLSHKCAAINLISPMKVHCALSVPRGQCDQESRLLPQELMMSYGKFRSWQRGMEYALGKKQCVQRGARVVADNDCEAQVCVYLALEVELEGEIIIKLTLLPHLDNGSLYLKCSYY